MGLRELLEERIDEIPTLPLVADKVMELLESPRSSASDLEKVINMDQSLAARVLKLVNSAYYGFPRRITTVGQGVVILGFNAIKHLVLSVSVADIFLMSGNNLLFDRSSLWKHSVGTAVGAKLLAKKAKFPLTEEAFIAGLLHDLGIVILDHYFPKEFERVVNQARIEQISFSQAEKMILGFNHALVGRMVAEKWNFPNLLVETIAYHNKPFQNKSYWATTALVYAADELSRQAGLGTDGDVTDPMIESKVWSWLKLRWSDRKSIVQELLEEVNKASDFIELVEA